MLNLELYKVFYTVAKCGSLTKAAQELYISQPAVSQSVKQLESQLGVTLFNRTHSGTELTSGGKLMYERIAEAISLFETAESDIMQMRTTAAESIRIGATDSIFSHILVDRIAAFSEQYPSVKLELISSTTPETLKKLKDGECDIAFLNLPVEDAEVTLLGEVSHLNDVFIAGKKYSHLKNTTVPLAQLQDYPLLMIEQNTITRKTLTVFLHNHGIELRPDIEVANWDLMINLVVKGMGVGCVPREYCTQQIASGELFELATSPALPARGVGIALPKNKPATGALKQFIAMF